ncbi:MAG: zinc ribbon domain-containing protein [Candidatus Marinimicrobia bacterium]|nr:zinc ribbon domain-containing protein [Candidatus Neomarinimicrobiota bacterium]
MPTYEFICINCGYTFEKFQSVNSDRNIKCPVCGGDTRLKFSSGAGIIFKGRGFYSTDYKDHTATGTCCGRSERCDQPPCADDGICRRGK